MTLHSRILCLAAVSTLILPLAEGQAQNEGQVSLQFVSFPRSNDGEPVELQIGEGRTIEVAIPTNEISPAYRVPRMAEWVVGKNGAGPDGQPAFNVFARGAALDSPSQLILLIRKGRTHAEGFEMVALDSRDTGFGGGRFLFLNASDVSVAGETGGERFALRPGAHTIVTPRAESGERSFHAMFYFSLEGRARPFFSSRWPVSDRARSLVFFYHDPNSGQLRFHTIRDFM